MLASARPAVDGLPIGAVAALFVTGAVAVLWAGSMLPVYGRRLAPRLGMAETAVGLFMLAIITSLPELSVTLSAMRFDAADLALGNVLGSNNFNLAAAGFLCFLFGGRLLTETDSRRYIRIGLLLVASTLVTGAGIVFGPHVGGWLPVVLFSLPVAVLFAVETKTAGESAPASGRADAPVSGRADAPVSGRAGAPVSGRAGAPASGRDAARGHDPEATVGTWIGFVALAIVVIAAGVAVSWAAKRIAAHPFAAAGGSLVLGETFVGTLLVAVATSLPEVTVAYSALRRAGSPDMAMGTLLGSNSFNLLVFALGAPLMLVWTTNGGSAWSNLAGGGVLGGVSGINPNLANAGSALALTFLMLGALRVTRAGTRGVALAAAAIPVYAVGLYAVFVLR